jgi:hypothetical protein
MPASSFSKWLAKIEATIVRRTVDNPTRSLAGWTIDKILDAVDAAIEPANHGLIEKVVGHV